MFLRTLVTPLLQGNWQRRIRRIKTSVRATVRRWKGQRQRGEATSLSKEAAIEVVQAVGAVAGVERHLEVPETLEAVSAHVDPAGTWTVVVNTYPYLVVHVPGAEPAELDAVLDDDASEPRASTTGHDGAGSSE